MQKLILYPFSIAEKNEHSYLQTMCLAKKINARVILFSTIEKEKDLDDVYLHLLELHGLYQTQINNWKQNVVKTKRAIKVGEFISELKNYLQKKTVDYIIVQPKKANDLQKLMIKLDQSQTGLITFRNEIN